MTALSRHPTGWRLWWLAVRPKTLSLAVAPVVAGAAMAWQQDHIFHPLRLATVLIAALLIQAGTNLHNDVADTVNGTDRHPRFGPARVTAQGWALPCQVRRAAWIAFALAALAGLALVAWGGWPILAVGLASLAAGWAYSSGPRPIATTPWGEVFVVAFFGLAAVAGSAWLQESHALAATLPLGLAMGLPAAAVLMANNYRDVESDRLAGRHTLAIVLGGAGSRWVYGALMLLPFVLLALPIMPEGAWGGLIALPLALKEIAAFWRETPGPAFNRILAGTARCQLALAMAASVGLVVAG